jgi:hypothetical protein
VESKAVIAALADNPLRFIEDGFTAQLPIATSAYALRWLVHIYPLPTY